MKKPNSKTIVKRKLSGMEKNSGGGGGHGPNEVTTAKKVPCLHMTRGSSLVKGGAIVAGSSHNPPGSYRVNKGNRRCNFRKKDVTVDIEPDAGNSLYSIGPNASGLQNNIEAMEPLPNGDTMVPPGPPVHRQLDIAITRKSGDIFSIPDCFPWLVMKILNGEAVVRFRGRVVPIVPSRQNSTVPCKRTQASATSTNEINGRDAEINPVTSERSLNNPIGSKMSTDSPEALEKHSYSSYSTVEVLPCPVMEAFGETVNGIVEDEMNTENRDSEVELEDEPPVDNFTHNQSESDDDVQYLGFRKLEKFEAMEVEPGIEYEGNPAESQY